MKEPRIASAPVPCPPGWGWALMAKRYDEMGDAEKAEHAQQMAEWSRKTGRSLHEGETYQERQFDAEGQGLLW